MEFDVRLNAFNSLIGVWHIKKSLIKWVFYKGIVNVVLLLVSKESIQKVASRLCDEVVIKNIEIEERGRNEEYTWHFSKGEIAHLKLFKISNCSVHNVLSLGERVETWFIKRPGASI